MKYMKMLGLVAAAAAALTAYVGVGTASATVLCSTETNPCTGTKYSVGQKLDFHLKAGTESTLVGGFATVKCASSTITGSITNAGGSAATVVASVSTWDFTSCNCTFTALLKGELEVHFTSAGDGALAGKNTLITSNCSGVSCLYGTAATATAIGVIQGGNPAVVNVEAKLPYFTGDASNFTCTLGSGTYYWSAMYEVTGPSPLYVAAS